MHAACENSTQDRNLVLSRQRKAMAAVRFDIVRGRDDRGDHGDVGIPSRSNQMPHVGEGVCADAMSFQVRDGER